MKLRRLTSDHLVSDQVVAEDFAALAARGIKSIVNHRPNGELNNQPDSQALAQAARAAGLAYRYLPINSQSLTSIELEQSKAAFAELDKPICGFCKSGTRAAIAWGLVAADSEHTADILNTVTGTGLSTEALGAQLSQLKNAQSEIQQTPSNAFDVAIIGGGAGGISTAASIHKRDRNLSIAIIEPSEVHRYQPGQTMVGGGVFETKQITRSMQSVMPSFVTWIKDRATQFQPEANAVVLENDQPITYKALVVAPGLTLNWRGIEGLQESLGCNGVTSNYAPEHAAYTWKLVNGLESGKALFSQSPLPIKCAGAPQKAVYLSCHAWERTNRLQNIDVEFHNAGGALFGVPDYVPALQSYMDRYGVNCRFSSKLVKVDGTQKIATFQKDDVLSEVEFDLLHVCPPQIAPAFVANSDLANAEGWVDVDQYTLQHNKYPNVFSLGDVAATPNAKTAAAVRKQAPVLATNLVAHLHGEDPAAAYDGYGSCPLTVEAGKVVLAEFGYGGALQPTLPKWLFDGTKPTRLGWNLKAKWLPPIYFELMLKGREWLATPNKLVPTTSQPTMGKG